MKYITPKMILKQALTPEEVREFITSNMINYGIEGALNYLLKHARAENLPKNIQLIYLEIAATYLATNHNIKQLSEEFSRIRDIHIKEMVFERMVELGLDTNSKDALNKFGAIMESDNIGYYIPMFNDASLEWLVSNYPSVNFITQLIAAKKSTVIKNNIYMDSFNAEAVQKILLLLSDVFDKASLVQVVSGIMHNLEKFKKVISVINPSLFKEIFTKILTTPLWYVENQDHSFVDLVKILVDRGFDIKSYESASSFEDAFHTLSEKRAELVEYLYKNGMSAREVVKILSHACWYSYQSDSSGEVMTIIYEKEVDKQIAFFQTMIEDGLDIHSLSFDELNVSELHPRALKFLISKGLDNNVLLINDFPEPAAQEILDMIVEFKLEIPSYALLTIINEGDEGGSLDSDFLRKFLKQIKLNPEQHLSFAGITAEIGSYGTKFKNYIEDGLEKFADLKQTIDTDLLAYNGTILHVLVKNGDLLTANLLLEKYPELNFNSLNALGETPLFYASKPEIADFLITHGTDQTIVNNHGKVWISYPNLQLINYLVTHNYLPHNFLLQTLKEHMAKGNFEHATKLLAISAEKDIVDDMDKVELLVDAIRNGLKESIEPNKYQALAQLFNKAGIRIPSKHFEKLNSVKDPINQDEFMYIDGLVHRLAKYYLSLNNEDKDNGYKAAVNALITLDNDFTLEVLTINGLFPEPLDKDIRVYRGMKFTLEDDDIQSLFNYGTRAFSIGKFQKILGYYVKSAWNDPVGAKWEFGGTYVSLAPHMAAVFASGITTKINEDSILLEINLPKGSPKICGSWKNEFELIPSYIEGKNIIAIYKLGFHSGAQHGKVYQVYANPKNQVLPKYGIGDTVVVDDESIAIYNSLGCSERFTDNIKKISTLYSSAEEFYNRFTEASYADDQRKLVENYFNNRETYQQLVFDDFFTECNPEFFCC